MFDELKRVLINNNKIKLKGGSGLNDKTNIIEDNDSPIINNNYNDLNDETELSLELK
jgi:hypothetical protein